MAFDKVKFLAAIKAMKEAFAEVQKFKDAKLKDGTIIRYEADKIDVGVPVLAVTESGAIALPDGDFEMEDGTKFTIVGGIVSAAMPADMPAEEAPAATAQAETNPAAPMNEAAAKAIVESIIKETRFAEDIAELKTQIEEFKKTKENFATQKTESEKEVEKLKTTIKELFALVEQIAGEPSTTPAENKREVFSISEFRKNYRADLAKLTEQVK